MGWMEERPSLLPGITICNLHCGRRDEAAAPFSGVSHVTTQSGHKHRLLPAPDHRTPSLLCDPAIYLCSFICHCPSLCLWPPKGRHRGKPTLDSPHVDSARPSR